MSSVWGHIKAFFRRHLMKVTMMLLILSFLAGLLYPMSVISIPSGHVGVLWRRFFGGTDTTTVWQEGIHLIAPFDELFIYDARLLQVHHDFDVLSSDGLNMTVNIAFRYRIVPEHVPILHKYVGRGYTDILLLPEIGSQARDIFATYMPDEIYTKRVEIQDKIEAQVRNNLITQFNPDKLIDVEYVKLEDILIRSIQLPADVQASIVRKVEQYHLSLEYVHRLNRERSEAQRREIEANGIRKFQEIIGEGITQAYLQWKGIDATLQLAQSPNAKVVIIGSGSSGLPLILGNIDGASAAGPGAGSGTVLLPGALNQPSGLTELQPPPLRLAVPPDDNKRIAVPLPAPAGAPPQAGPGAPAAQPGRPAP
ncbi:prohibitin family protein (plasmid) [Skermanella sp. TT6]|uniref:Prohibitin family protein n=1 Tax=Skermanella cutis TaxID=2775420 RepID=A0ABX7BME7_9PROT|nr:prohibitin family protein [Skermanella sp. TT6]QQP93603.1 prohibitin family protein [Skermanella sp. TT6]